MEEQQMMKKGFWKIFLLSIIVLSVSVWAGCRYFEGEPNEGIHIALAGPFGESMGEAFTQGIKVYVDKVNKGGGINGKKIILDFFDDQNDAGRAKEKALEIAKQNQAVAVIGHSYSSCSISAGEIYKKHGIPAVSPVSTSVNVTRGNEWYFRTIFDDNLQGRFLANYTKKVLKQDSVTIIFDEDGAYGRYLARIFEETSETIGLEVKYKWSFKSKAENRDQTLKKIVEELAAEKSNAGAIFLAAHSGGGISLVKLIKDMNIQNPIITPDSFASKKFATGFSECPQEIKHPGYYTNGIYVTTPLIFDTANESAQAFREEYKSKYGKVPDTYATFAYDSIMVILEAVKDTGITGKPDTIKDDRKKIRDYIANINSIENALDGLTGPNYFDENGNCPKPIAIGVYRSKSIISALGQLQPVRHQNLIPDIEESLRQGHVLLFDEKYMYKTNVVYTGIELNSITDLNIRNASCVLDFYLWFRHQGEIDAYNIEFLNAIEPIRLDSGEEEAVAAITSDEKKDAKTQVMVKLIKKETKGDLTSRVYRIKAPFKNDFAKGQGFEEHQTLGFKFRHRELARNNLVYVTDILGMGLSDSSPFVEGMKANAVLSPEYGWSLAGAGFFQDISKKSTMKSLKYLNVQKKFTEYSQFNFWTEIKKGSFSLRRKISDKAAGYLTALSFFMVVLLIFASVYKSLGHFSKSVWFFKMIFTFLLLLTSEVFILKTLLENGSDMRYLRLTILTFDSLWWIVPAFFTHLALTPFVWESMEKQSGRPVPAVIRRFPAYIIYFIAAYGIVAFVFDQDITKLMATSGAVAMFAGLLVKDNITNYFASISLIQGYQLKIGHWVRIGDFREGEIREITKLTTNLITRDGSMLSIPNSVVLDSTIYNYDYPDNTYRLNFTLETDEGYSPDRVMRILDAALLSTECILKDPPPQVQFRGQGDSSAIYRVLFTVRDYGKKWENFTAAWRNVWIHLEKAGIELATPHRVIHLHEEESPQDDEFLEQKPVQDGLLKQKPTQDGFLKQKA